MSIRMQGSRSQRESDSESDTEELDKLIRAAQKKISSFCETRGTQHLCLRDGFATGSRNIMYFHIAQRHAEELIESQKYTGLECRRDSVLQSSTSADEELALQLALQDYDELQDKKSFANRATAMSSDTLTVEDDCLSRVTERPIRSKSKEHSSTSGSLTQFVRQESDKRGKRVFVSSSPSSSSSSDSSKDFSSTDSDNDNQSRGKKDSVRDKKNQKSSSYNKKKEISSYSSPKPDLDEPGHLTFEERKKLRLERLLAKTSAIVDKLSGMMNLFTKDHIKTQEASDAETGRPSKPKYLQSAFLDGGVLRDYQLRGVEWLCGIHYSGLNGILADEMGLGKTVQVIAFLCSLWERYSICGPHIVVVPMSVLNTWRDDILKFSPGISLYIHHGHKEKRLPALALWKRNFSMSRKRFFASPNEKRANHIHIVLTTYDIAIKDFALLKAQNQRSNKWAYLVVSEDCSNTSYANSRSRYFSCE